MEQYAPLSRLAFHVSETPNQPFLHQPRDRQWQSYSFSEVDQQARCVAQSLKEMGLNTGDHVAILAKNSAEWMIADLAIMMAGMVSVPIYFTAALDTIQYILEHSHCQALFIGKLDKPEGLKGQLPSSLKTINMGYPSIPCDYEWSKISNHTSPLTNMHSPSLEDTITTIYTSGSTGRPKGVMLSYKNICATARESAHLIEGGFNKSDRVLSYLPLAHIAERGAVELNAICSGMQVYFVESLDTFADDLRYTRPTLFFAVPRIWLKMQLKVLAKVSQPTLARILVIPFINKIFAKKLRQGMGLDQVRASISGAAPLAPNVMKWFHKIGINISEGWAMSETGCVGSLNLPFNPDRIGTIGEPGNDRIQMKLTEDSEIIMKGDFIMKGYYKNDEATAEVIRNGWLHTGDLGRINDDGSFSIIGRVKEQFKSSKGKYISPVGIEAQLSGFAEIEQVCVSGRGLPHPIAFIVLADGVKQDAHRMMKIMKKVNRKLEAHERLDALYVCDEPWLIENGLLTPTMKIKRTEIELKYAAILDDFAENERRGEVIFE